MRIYSWLFIAAAILLRATPTQKDDVTFLAIWNVGQGQWVTLVESRDCHHFDLGGERNPIKEVAAFCKFKKNGISISHWDWDHLSFLNMAKKHLSPVELMHSPIEAGQNMKKKRILNSMKNGLPPPHIEHIFPVSLEQWIEETRQKYGKRASNHLSHVFLVKRRILIPGDSTQVEEKIWRNNPRIRSTHWLILGHHGSLTSTTPKLLDALPNLKQAIVSSRFRRYGHPHPRVLQRLWNKKIPTIQTESWGHIAIEIRE